MARRLFSPLEYTAYHEAGHAVVAHLLYQWFLYLTIVPGSKTQGHCAFVQASGSKCLWKPETPHSALDARRNAASHWDEILIAYAGPAAEETFAGQIDV